jgi:hypothetical protein
MVHITDMGFARYIGSACEAYEIWADSWTLNDLHELAFVYEEMENYLPSFMTFYRLENKFQFLKGDMMTRNEVAILGSHHTTKTSIKWDSNGY